MPAALPEEISMAEQEGHQSADHIKPEDVRAPLKRKAVPLLPSLREDEASWNYIDEKMKHAREMIRLTVSVKPAKLARYDQQIGKERDLSGIIGYGQATATSRDVIPLDELRMEERHTPLDVKAFLSRVGTFDLRLWSGKPNRLCAYECARYGWRIAGKNTLLCVSCRNLLSIPNDHGGSQLDEWTTCIEEQIHKTGHMSDCIWVRSPSPLNILLLPEGNDMQTYMKNAAQSFNRMRTVPVLSGSYQVILDSLDMTGLKDKTELQLFQTIEGTSLKLMEQFALFLMLNGWTMDDMDINALQCHLCLRQVPLWLCSPIPSSVSTENTATPSVIPLHEAPSHVKYLDPIASHWFWCPWRKMLQRSGPEKKVQPNVLAEGTGELNAENFSPNLKSYMNLALKIDADFKRGRLVHGRQTLEMSDNTIAFSTISNFKELLNTLQSGNTSSSNTVPGSVWSNDVENDMVSIIPLPTVVAKTLETPSEPQAYSDLTSAETEPNGSQMDLASDFVQEDGNIDQSSNLTQEQDYVPTENETTDIINDESATTVIALEMQSDSNNVNGEMRDMSMGVTSTNNPTNIDENMFYPQEKIDDFKDDGISPPVSYLLDDNKGLVSSDALENCVDQGGNEQLMNMPLDFQPLEQSVSEYLEPLENNAATQDDEYEAEVENVQVISRSPVSQITDDLTSVTTDNYNTLPDADHVSNVLASAAEGPSYQPIDEVNDHVRFDKDNADNQDSEQEENHDDEGHDYADDENDYSNENEDICDNAEYDEVVANNSHPDSDESDIVYLN